MTLSRINRNVKRLKKIEIRKSFDKNVDISRNLKSNEEKIDSFSFSLTNTNLENLSIPYFQSLSLTCLAAFVATPYSNLLVRLLSCL